MRLGSLTLVLAALSLACAGAHADDGQKCTLVRKASLAMRSEPSGRVTVPMTVGGQELHLLVDTGGVVSSLSPINVQSLGLRTSGIAEVGIEGLKGDRMLLATQVHDAMLDKVRLGRWNFLVEPDARGEGDGTLAPDILNAYDADFDFGNGKLNLISKDHCSGAVVYWTNDDHAEIPFTFDQSGHIVVAVQLDGKSLKAAIDTGASRSLMSLEEARSLFGGETPASAAAAGESPRGAFNALGMGGVTVRHPEIALISESDAKLFAMPGSEKLIIGVGVLRHLHLYIAYGEKMLYITPATAH